MVIGGDVVVEGGRVVVCIGVDGCAEVVGVVVVAVPDGVSCVGLQPTISVNDTVDIKISRLVRKYLTSLHNVIITVLVIFTLVVIARLEGYYSHVRGTNPWRWEWYAWRDSNPRPPVPKTGALVR